MGGIKHALFSQPAPTRSRHVRALLLRCREAFFSTWPTLFVAVGSLQRVQPPFVLTNSGQRSPAPALQSRDSAFGETLQLIIVADAPDGKTMGSGVASNEDQASTNTEHSVGTIREMLDALRDCRVPPPQDQALPGMQMSVRFSLRQRRNHRPTARHLCRPRCASCDERCVP
jgi:hypothetical protein